MRMMIVAATAAALLLSGCQGMEENPKQTGGMVIGAIGGALIGSQFGGGSGRVVGAAVGSLAGALIGSEIGRLLDAADRAAMQRASMQAYNAPMGEPVTWQNPQSGHHRQVVPVNQGYIAGGLYCRQFEETVYVAGRPTRALNTAC